MRVLIGVFIFGVLSWVIIFQGSGAVQMRLPSFDPDAAPAEATAVLPSEVSASAAK
mgnify:CR=1 FL=1